MKIFIYIALIAAYKIIKNTVACIQLAMLKNEYFRWIDKPEEYQVQTQGHAPQVRKLIRGAGVRVGKVPVLEPMGFNQAVSGTVDVLNRYPTKEANYAYPTICYFNEAIGTYKHRIIETFNPLYWIETILFLPKSIFVYFGLKPENIIIKIFQLVWWLITTISLLFREQIASYFLNLLKSLNIM
jgi:hypothetical protein